MSPDGAGLAPVDVIVPHPIRALNTCVRVAMFTYSGVVVTRVICTPPVSTSVWHWEIVETKAPSMFAHPPTLTALRAKPEPIMHDSPGVGFDHPGACQLCVEWCRSVWRWPLQRRVFPAPFAGTFSAAERVDVIVGRERLMT